MVLAVTLIVAGLGLLIFGARVFFAVLFLAAGLYLILSLLSIRIKAERRREKELSFLKEQLRDKLSEEDLEWLTSFFTSPMGRKLIVWIKEKRENITVRISIPVSLILLLRPFLNSLAPIVARFLNKKIPFSVSEEDLKVAMKLINSCLDEISTYRGDFVHIETETATVRIGLA